MGGGLERLAAFLLMRQDLGQDWARIYAAHACAAIVAVGAAVYSLADGRSLGLAQWCQIGLGYVGLAVIVVAVLLLTGTSLVAMAHNLVGGPTTQIFLHYCMPLKVSYGYWSGTAALLFAVIAVAWRRRLARLLLAIAAAKGLYGVLGTLVFVLQSRCQLSHLLPWIWLVMLPSGRDGASKSEDTFPRAILCLVAAWQGLQAYPVAGSQVAIGTFLFIPVYSLCLYDAIATFTRELSALRHRPRLSPQTGLLLKGLVFANLVVPAGGPMVHALLLLALLHLAAATGFARRPLPSSPSLPSRPLPGTHALRRT